MTARRTELLWICCLAACGGGAPGGSGATAPNRAVIPAVGLALQRRAGWRFLGWLGTNESWSYDHVGESVEAVDVTNGQLIPGGPPELFVELRRTEFDTSGMMVAMWTCEQEGMSAEECDALLDETPVHHATYRVRLVCAERAAGWACARYHGPIPDADTLDRQLVCGG